MLRHRYLSRRKQQGKLTPTRPAVERAEPRTLLETIFIHHRPLPHECARKTTFKVKITLSPGMVVRPVIAEAALAVGPTALSVDDRNGAVHCHSSAPFIRRSACRR